MNIKGRPLLIGLSLIMLFSSACKANLIQASPTVTPIPPTPTFAPPTPVPEPGLGIPIGSGGWQITLDAVRTADSLKSGYWPNETTFTPKEGYSFLIVDLAIRSLDPTHAMQINLDNVAILDANKSIHTANGGGWGETNMCAGCSIVLSRDVGASITSVSAIVLAGQNMSFQTASISSEEPFSFVFVVGSEVLNQEWQLQFKDIQLTPFKLGDQVGQRLTTESVSQASPLPQGCHADTLKLAQTDAGLLYQEWSEDKLTTKLAFIDGRAPVPLCTDFAYQTLQIAPDGGLLLKAGPWQGWANLYLIEPDGRIVSLVRNALAVDGEFVPGTNQVAVSVKSLGKEGEELYLYDRDKAAMTLLYEGQWINHRIFPDGNMLVTGMLFESEDNFQVMGLAGSGELPALRLPEGSNNDYITSDGKHVLYTEYVGEKNKLFLSNLDGSEKREVMSDDAPYGDKALSPDGNYVLMEVAGEAEYTEQACLYDLATGSCESITPDSQSLEYAFSPDGKWVVAISTFKREENDEAKTQKETLYLFNMSDKKVVKDIQGEIVNYYFSPDNGFLAYTMKNEDETLSIFVVKLADFSEQPVGQGLLTGWGVNLQEVIPEP